jgi:hypothetical protein
VVSFSGVEMSKKNQSYVTFDGKSVIPSWCQAPPGTHPRVECYVSSVWSSSSDDSVSLSVVSKIPPFTVVHIFIYTLFPLVYAEGGRHVFTRAEMEAR